MKKIILNLACLLALVGALYLSACGGQNEKKVKNTTIKPKTTIIKGDLSAYFEVVERDYEIKIDQKSSVKSGLISVEVKRTDKDFDFPTDKINPFGTNGSENYHVGFGIEIFGENEPEYIANPTASGMSGIYSSDDAKGLMKLKKGETAFIRWSVDEHKLDKLKTFQLSSALEKTERSQTTSPVENSKSEPKNTNNANTATNSEWDSALNKYEEYTDQCIKLLKKAKDNDAYALIEYTSFLVRAQEMQSKLNKAAGSGKLSTPQMARFVQIQAKHVKAATEPKLK